MNKRKIFLLVSLVILAMLISGCGLFSGFKKEIKPGGQPAEDSMFARHIPGQLLIKTTNSEELKKVLNNFSGEIVGYLDKLQVYKVNLDVSIKGSLNKTIKFFKANPHFTYVEPVYIYQPLIQIQDQEYYNRQWGPMSIGLDEALELAPKQGEGVVIAILDTGVDYTHPEFVGRVSPGYNVFSDEISFDAAFDDVGHGTHVAGIAAANLNSAKMVGIAPKSTILPVRVLTSEGGTDYDVARGILWAVDNGADIINMSLGGKGYSQALQDAINVAVVNNVVVVAAMGNTGKNEVLYPGGCTGVIAVGATNGRQEVSSFSTKGSHISVSAPGENIYSSVPVEMGSYDIYNGTSMATPHVTGAIALLLGEHSAELNYSQIKSRLEKTALDIGSYGYDENSGYGIIDLVRFLNNDATDKYGSLAVSVTYYGEPLSGAEVMLLDQQKNVIRNLHTDGTGTIIMHNIDSGTYLVRVNAYGTIVEQANVVINVGNLTRVDFSDIAPLLPTALEGYVVDSRGGTGVSGAALTITSETTGSVFNTITDDNGHFTISLAADKYTVLVENAGFGASRYQSIVIEENRIKSITILQPPAQDPAIAANPPTITVTGISINDTLSGTVDASIEVTGELDIQTIEVRFGHLGTTFDHQAVAVNQLDFSLNTTKKGNGQSYVDIMAYDTNNNVAQWTIPVVIDNTQESGQVPAKVLINNCWAMTYGESLGIYRQTMENLYYRLGVSKDVSTLEIAGEEYDVRSAPDDATILIDLKWGVRLEATGYKIYRSTSFPGPYYQIADFSLPNYIDYDGSLQLGQRYYYKVAAYNSSGIGEFSDSIWTEPLDVFNVSLESPTNGGINDSVTPSFLWSHDLVEHDQKSFFLVLEGITNPAMIWTSMVRNKINKVYTGEDLIPGHEYSWNIYDAQASKKYSDYSGATSFSGQDGTSLNGSFTFTVASDAGGSVRENILEMVIDEADGETEAIELDLLEEGNYDIYTTKYQEDCDTILYLYDAEMNEIDYNDDDLNQYARIATYLYPGTYYIRVQVYEGSQTRSLKCNLFVDLVRY